MNALQEFVNGGLVQTVERLGTPVFTWKSADYSCVPSVNDFNRQLETGGFSTGRMLTMTVPLLDDNGGDIFATLPQPQDLVTYNDEQYRIETTKKHPTGVYMRIVAMSTTRGI